MDKQLQLLAKQYQSIPHPSPRDKHWKHLILGNYDYAYNHLGAINYTIDDESGMSISSILQPTDQTSPQSTHKLRLMHDLFWTSGQHIIIPRHAVIPLPILLDTSSSTGTALPHRQIMVQEGAQVSFVERTQSGKSTLSSSHTTIDIANGARVEYIVDLGHGKNIEYFHHLDVNCAAQSQFSSHVFAHGKGTLRSEVTVNLSGEGAEARMYGLGMIGGKGQQLFSTTQAHNKPQTTSKLDYRVLATDNGRSSFVGVIRIDQEANQSDAYQRNANILFSNQAKVHTQPELEILTDDVRCTHGATSGPLDHEHLFYAGSRGIDTQSAKRLLTYASVMPLVDSIENTIARRFAASLIKRTVRLAVK